MDPHPSPLFKTVSFAIGWILLVAGGLGALMQYESAPGKVGIVPPAWPTDQIDPSKDRPTLVMLAHPRCPCTRASVGELAQIMTRLQGKVDAYVLFFEPTKAGPDWQDTSLRQAAAAIPGVTIRADVDGAEARRFGAETSGHTLLFAPDGTLLFSGGITKARGHAGDNAGENAIVSLVNDRIADRARTFIFGCSLADSQPISRAIQPPQ